MGHVACWLRKQLNRMKGRPRENVTCDAVAALKVKPPRYGRVKFSSIFFFAMSLRSVPRAQNINGLTLRSEARLIETHRLLGAWWRCSWSHKVQ